MNNVLIIFGATGDLMDKKISPSLYTLNIEKPGVFQKIIGFGRRDLTNEAFRELIKTSIAKKLTVEDSALEDFLAKVEYHKGEFQDLASFEALNKKVAEQYPEASKHIYLAVPPELYNQIITNLGEAQFIDQNTKLMVEKPIGHDLTSSNQTEELFSKHFKESQIYRIDHYLGKDSVQNILSFRFANAMFDPIWNNQYVKKIEIRALETLGVETRGDFYDKIGALRDFGQNHLLQMLAISTMDEPGVLCCENIRDSRAKLLSMVKVMNVEEVKTQTFRAQYEGYTNIEGVSKDSQIETYFKIKCSIDSDRWRGVPIYLEHGKRISAVNKEVMFHLKDINKVIFSLEPEDSIKIFVQTKKAGITFENEDNMMTLNMKDRGGSMQYVAEYVELFHDFFMSDQTFFVSRLESELMWKFTQPILEAWQSNVVPLEKYNTESNEAATKADAKLAI